MGGKRVLAIYQFLLGWKTLSSIMKATNSATQGQPNPRKNNVKSGIWAAFPTADIFSWVEIHFIHRKQTTRNTTEPDSFTKKLKTVCTLISTWNDPYIPGQSGTQYDTRTMGVQYGTGPLTRRTGFTGEYEFRRSLLYWSCYWSCRTRPFKNKKSTAQTSLSCFLRGMRWIVLL